MRIGDVAAWTEEWGGIYHVHQIRVYLTDFCLLTEPPEAKGQTLYLVAR